MSELISLLLAFVTAMWNNTPYVPADDKPFMNDSYYQIQQDGIQDDRELYNNTIARMTTTTQKCDLTPYQIDSTSSRKIVETGEGNVYLPFTLKDGTKPEDVISNAKSIEINKEKYYLFSVEEGTEIIAPYNSTLENSSTIVGTVYPDADPCKGVSLTIETDETADGDRYKITYASLKRLWCNMRKADPDDKYNNDDKKPLYYLDDAFTGKTTFNQKDVLGEAGKTGVPDSVFSDSAYIAIRVQKYSLGSYKDVDIKDLCKIN